MRRVWQKLNCKEEVHTHKDNVVLIMQTPPPYTPTQKWLLKHHLIPLHQFLS